MKPAHQGETSKIANFSLHLRFGHDKSKSFPKVQNPERIGSLVLWHCSYRSMEDLRLFTNLHTLIIATYPDSTLDPLQSLRNLRHLDIVHLPKVSDLSPLTSLPQLRCLCLQTLPSWDGSGKRTVVNSLQPIALLPNLQHISLFGVVPPDRSLADLEKCHPLISARFSGYPDREIERFFHQTGISNKHAPQAPPDSAR